MKNLIALRIKQNIKIKRIIVIELILLLLLFLFAKGFENYQEEYKQTQRIVVGLDNQDSSLSANMLVNNFKSTAHFSDLFELKETKEEDFKADLKNGRIDAAVIMPKGFADALYRFENKPVKLISKTSTPIKNAILEETLSGYSKYVKAVDMACYAYNNIVEEKEMNPEIIDAYEKGITVDLLYSTLNRSDYFDQIPLSEVKLVNSTEYYSIVIPFSFIAFISLLGAFKKIKERDLSINRRIKISGISTLTQQIADYLAEILFILLIFSPLVAYRFYLGGLGSGFTFIFSILLSGVFFSSLWKALSHLLKSRENLLVLGISISFLNALLSGAIVPYILLGKNIKTLSAYSINFILTKFSMGITGFAAVLPFLILFMVLFFLDLRQEARR